MLSTQVPFRAMKLKQHWTRTIIGWETAKELLVHLAWVRILILVRGMQKFGIWSPTGGCFCKQCNQQRWGKVSKQKIGQLHTPKKKSVIGSLPTEM